MPIPDLSHNKAQAIHMSMGSLPSPITYVYSTEQWPMRSDEENINCCKDSQMKHTKFPYNSEAEAGNDRFDQDCRVKLILFNCHLL